MIKIILRIFQFIILIVFGFLACTNPKDKLDLKAGDILFQDLDCGPLCDAIESVTNGVDGKSFSHCGIVINHNDTLMVIEAIGREVQLNTIEDFLDRSGDSGIIKNVCVGRLKREHQALIAPALDFAKDQLGEAYDEEFLFHNESWYCSELIYESFKAANKNLEFFEAEAMTFKDPQSNDFYPAWIDYYNQLQKEIPEGKLGTNPALISRSNKLTIYYSNSFKN